jgi:3-oxoacyl-[acyl-carrier-protein] synthase-3
MVIKLAGAAGLTPEQLYFNIETVGNTSAASIPLAIADAKADGVITEPLRVFAPGFGAGAVGGYAVLRVDPAVIADETADSTPAAASASHGAEITATPSENVHAAFG